jgi:NAD-dependent deacetylase
MGFTRLDPLVVLTGAGVSAESGIPTFRGADGLWRTYRVEDLATPTAFQQDPKLVWEFYAWRRELIAACEPNKAHLLLAEIEKQTSDFTLITQNVDGLHTAGGSDNVLELHGSIWRLRCSRCEHRWEDRSTLEKLPPSCPACGAMARPDVVWFGETLDPKILERAFDVTQHAQVMLIIGTSGFVHPAAGLPRLCKSHGGRLIEINLEVTPFSGFSDKVYRSMATMGLQEWWEDQLE